MITETWTYASGNQSANVALDEFGNIHIAGLSVFEPGDCGTRSILCNIAIRVDADDAAERLQALEAERDAERLQALEAERLRAFEAKRKAKREAKRKANENKRMEARRLLREHGFTPQPQEFVFTWLPFPRSIYKTGTPEAERGLFEADAEPYGFDLARRQCAAPEPWAEYESEATGHRWAGWLAARAMSSYAKVTDA